MNIRDKKREHNILKGYNMLLYFAGTMVMFDPSNECIHDFWSQGILKSLPVSSKNPRFLQAASQLRESVDKNGATYERMKLDYNELFSGSANPKAPPFESVYRSRDHLLFERSTPEVREFYRSYGWKSKFGETIQDDHIGIELLFLTLMIEKYLELDDEACIGEMRKEIMRFLDLHIMSWVPMWNDNIQEYAVTLGYKGIGTLIYACAEDIYQMMDSPVMARHTLN